MLRSILLIILFSIPCILNSQTHDNSSLYSASNILKFADNLFNQNEYKRAALEYEKYIFLENNPPDSIRFKIGLCYYTIGEYDLSSKKWETFLTSHPQSKLLNQTHFFLAYTDFKKRQFQLSESRIAQIPLISPFTDQLKLQTNYLLVANKLSTQKWIEAEKLLSDDLLFLKPNNHRNSLKQMLEEGKNIKQKSPLFAGAFSAVIPGAGKFYAGRSIDGLFTFFLHGFMVWQAWDGFAEKNTKSVKGWLFSGLGSVFYIGNIYGSAIAVKIYNKNINDNFDQKIRFELRTLLGN